MKNMEENGRYRKGTIDIERSVEQSRKAGMCMKVKREQRYV
jgi:hypothetical protein